MSPRVRQEIADLNPGYAALVMATGIVSTGLDLFGWHVLSTILLAVAVVAFALLLVAYAWRAVAYPRRLLADVRDPGVAFGYFTLVAAPNVLAIRVALDNHLLISAVLSLASVPVWLVLTYVIPGALVVGNRREPVLPRANGTWFMWVVGTQSVAAAAAILGASNTDWTEALGPVAVTLWGIGVVLYLMLVSLVTVKLLDEPVTPHALSPTYWVYMGATAITVLAAAKILTLPTTLPVMESTRPAISGIAFLLWAFGTWWIPLLLAFAAWRHLVHQEPVGYEPALWSVVFPLGMYAAATASYGRAAELGFMVTIARVELWAGFAAWVAVAAAMGRSIATSGAPSSSGRPRRLADGFRSPSEERG